MIKYYGTKICKDCVAASEALQNANVTLDYVDITESTANMKEFLHLRDTREEFNEIRARGGIGIPCFLEESGRISFDVRDYVPEAEGFGGCASCR